MLSFTRRNEPLAEVFTPLGARGKRVMADEKIAKCKESGLHPVLRYRNQGQRRYFRLSAPGFAQLDDSQFHLVPIYPIGQYRLVNFQLQLSYIPGYKVLYRSLVPAALSVL